MKKIILISVLLSSFLMVSFAGEGRKSGAKKEKIEKFKNLTDEEKAELHAKRTEKITEKLREKGKTEAEIAEILKKREDFIQNCKAKLEEYKAKLKSEGKTEEEIEKILSEKREKCIKKFKKSHKHKKSKEWKKDFC